MARSNSGWLATAASKYATPTGDHTLPKDELGYVHILQEPEPGQEAEGQLPRDLDFIETTFTCSARDQEELHRLMQRVAELLVRPAQVAQGGRRTEHWPELRRLRAQRRAWFRYNRSDDDGDDDEQPRQKPSTGRRQRLSNWG